MGLCPSQNQDRGPRETYRKLVTPGFRFDRAHADPAGRVAGSPIAGKLSGTQRHSMRAGRPRSRVGLFPSLLLLKGAGAGLSGHTRVDAAEPSRLVALLCPSCPFVDRSCSSRGRTPACRATAREMINKNSLLRQCRELRESCEAAVGVGIATRRHLQTILIEQRSCGSGSPAG